MKSDWTSYTCNCGRAGMQEYAKKFHLLMKRHLTFKHHRLTSQLNANKIKLKAALVAGKRSR